MASHFGNTKQAMILVLCLLAALAVPTQAQWGTAVDPFETDQDSIESTSQGTPSYSYQDGTDILGGEREIKVECTSGSCTNKVYASVNESLLNHSQGVGAYGYTLMTWDGNDNSTAIGYTGLGVNLTSGGADRIHIIGIEADHDGSDLIITVYSDEDHWSVAGIINIPEFEVPTDLTLLFNSDFSTGSGADGPADFTNVGAITLEINGRSVNSLDMSIDLIAAGGPTAVSLTSFNAAPTSGNILLSWETGSETDLQGFNLHRSETMDGTYSQINTSVIPAENHGQPIGASYSWLDEDVVRGETYYYKLEGLEDGGLTTFFGPVSARAVHTVYLPLLVRN